MYMYMHVHVPSSVLRSVNVLSVQAQNRTTGDADTGETEQE